MRALAAVAILLGVACGADPPARTCDGTVCAPGCRAVYYGEDRSGCGVCLCGGQICSPLTCEPGDLGADAGLPVDDAGCAFCALPADAAE
jgi:hypothetical protein